MQVTIIWVIQEDIRSLHYSSHGCKTDSESGLRGVWCLECEAFRCTGAPSNLGFRFEG